MLRASEPKQAYYSALIAIERLVRTSRKGAAVFLDGSALGVLIFVVVMLFYVADRGRNLSRSRRRRLHRRKRRQNTMGLMVKA
jgi:hypothetical protein